VLRVPLGLVKILVFTERWPGHSSDQKKKKNTHDRYHLNVFALHYPIKIRGVTTKELQGDKRQQFNHYWGVQ
jgi:hypothetical protein